jgi:hypothetical protein
VKAVFGIRFKTDLLEAEARYAEISPRLAGSLRERIYYRRQRHLFLVTRARTPASPVFEGFHKNVSSTYRFLRFAGPKKYPPRTRTACTRRS